MPIQAYAAQAPHTRLESFTYDPGPLGPEEVEIKVTHCGKFPLRDINAAMDRVRTGKMRYRVVLEA
jgi:D-arabinose 1-dehydrogenase-like Zn-dependent alcohol dehydrogenase